MTQWHGSDGMTSSLWTTGISKTLPTIATQTTKTVASFDQPSLATPLLLNKKHCLCRHNTTLLHLLGPYGLATFARLCFWNQWDPNIKGDKLEIRYHDLDGDTFQLTLTSTVMEFLETSA